MYDGEILTMLSESNDHEESFCSDDQSDLAADSNPCNWSFETISADELELPEQEPPKPNPYKEKGEQCNLCGEWYLKSSEILYLYRTNSKGYTYKTKCPTCIKNCILNGYHAHNSVCKCPPTNE
jgi:hypothetical protein